jgi:hypothetical protein
MLYGKWDSDLSLRIQQAVGSVKAQAWGLKDLSSNIARGSCSAVATLYDRAPAVTGSDEVARLIAQAGYWSQQQRNQRDTIGMRELFVRTVVRPDGITYWPIPPHRICATPDPEDPSRPIEIRHQRWRKAQNAWLWDVWEPGCYRVEDDSGKDLSADVIGGRQERASYVSRFENGDPFLPWTVYHAARTGELFDPYEARELWEGSLNSAVGWTMWQHVVKDASWPQRWILGAVFKGLGIVGDGEVGKRLEVVTDPATVVQLEVAPDFAGQPQVGQWAAGMDPEVLAGSLDRYDRRVAAYGGINPADVQRVSGDPKSGYAIAITREAQREAQRRFSPVFAPADEELVAKTAALLNRIRGTSYPESGYRVIYESLPPTPDELESQRKQLEFEIAANMLSSIDVYRRLHPGVEADDARAAIISARLANLAMDRDFEAAAKAAGLIADAAEVHPEPAAAKDPAEDAGDPEDAAEVD